MNGVGDAGSQKQLSLCQWENYFSSSGFEPRTVQPVASQYTDYAFTPHLQFTFCNVLCFLAEILWHVRSGEKKSWRQQIYSWWLISKTQNCISWERKSCNVAQKIQKIIWTAVHLNLDGSYHSWKQIKQHTRSMVLFLPNPHSQHKITMFNKFRTILFSYIA